VLKKWDDDYSKLFKETLEIGGANCQHQITIIDDSVWQSCIFEGLIFDWFKAVIMHFGFKGRSAMYGIFWFQSRPKDEDLLRCGTR
jgi:hypothetical protein